MPSPAIFAFNRITPIGILHGLPNFTETSLHLSVSWLREQGVVHFHDALSDRMIEQDADTFILPPYRRVWVT